MEEFVNILNLPWEWENIDGDFITTIDTSDNFQHAYLILAKSEILNLDEDASSMTENTADLIYYSNSEKYKVELYADFDSDEYKCTVSEVEETDNGKEENDTDNTGSEE